MHDLTHKRYLDEYSREDTVTRYISNSAGAGIGYLLKNVYGPIYSRVIHSLASQYQPAHSFRVLEYGCGAGMNLLHIITLLREQGLSLDRAIGTDFSPSMIKAARQEVRHHLAAEAFNNISYLEAANETLAQDLALGLGTTIPELTGTFDLILGVNTFRYAHRLKKDDDCARDIFNLLRPGGYSIMIDMNNRFPLFRSRLRDVLTRPKHEYYLPSLQDYARPFRTNGLVITEARHFCWIPHSSSPWLLSLCRKAAPILDASVPTCAMRSLVIAQKPAGE